jgi:ligand-binding sensor domain-containing protein/serine phosphatase RsbU (regulator of sigma subunit)
MKKLIFILFPLMLAFLPKQLLAQKYYFDNYSVKEGLSQSKVYDVIQDVDGFIWIGTASGVSRFDGKHFQNFSSDDGLSENGIQTIIQDSEGQIWFGHTGGGISIYDGNIFYNPVPDTLKINGDITCFFEDSKHRMWIGTQGSGAFLIEDLRGVQTGTTNYHHFTGKTKLSDRIYYITQTANDSIYLVIDNMIKSYDEQEKNFKTYKHKGLSFYFQITSMFEDADLNLWYGTYNGGLYRQDNETGNVTVFDSRDGLANNFISCISQDAQGAIWVGTWGGGITRINPNFLTFNQENGLAGNKIRKIISDREGNILIGTNENGLSIFKGEHFVSFLPEHGLLSEQVSAIAEDNRNNIWIGTDNGLCKYNLTGKTIKSIPVSKQEMNHEIISLKKASDGTLWIATKQDGIYSYAADKTKLNYNPGFNSMVLRYGRIITSMEIDSDDHIWVGTIDGLYYLEPENNAYDRIMGNEISTLFFDSKKNMWVGIKGKGITRIHDTAFEPLDTLGNVNPLCFAEDSLGNLWIGTEGTGVIVFSPNQTITRYKTDNGLLADLITAMRADNEGNMWIGTNKGLNKFDAKTKTFYGYTQRSGFTGIEVKSNALFSDKTGNVWCGTVNGLFKFSPDKEKLNTLEPLTHITNMKVNLKDREMSKGLKLNYTDKNIYFEYHSICLTDAEKVRYKVKLDGADEDWLPETTQTYKTYSPLPPGRYTFKVIACNNRGVWNKQAVSFAFIIKPPFYLRWWFILIVVILLVSGIIMYINIRERNLKNEKIILENKVKERTAEVVKKNDELAKKNKDIMDSINYAKRIQQAILPSDALVKNHAPDSFVLFKPKDVVSGDFYWFEGKEDYFMFSVIDCTGHGVPGAFMSIMGHENIQRSVSEFKLKQPDKILNKLNLLVQESLQSSDNPDVKDGMDMSFCVFHKQTRILQYAGANNPIYIIRSADKPPLIKDGENLEPVMVNCGFQLYETKANKQPIGAYINRVPFTNHNFELMPGDAVYVFTDGYADQFGGKEGRKFMYKNLKETLLQNQELPMERQKSFYNQIINAWKGNHEQIDDICLMGIKIE